MANDKVPRPGLLVTVLFALGLPLGLAAASANGHADRPSLVLSSTARGSLRKIEVSPAEARYLGLYIGNRQLSRELVVDVPGTTSSATITALFANADGYTILGRGLGQASPPETRSVSLYPGSAEPGFIHVQERVPASPRTNKSSPQISQRGSLTLLESTSDARARLNRELKDVELEFNVAFRNAAELQICVGDATNPAALVQLPVLHCGGGSSRVYIKLDAIAFTPALFQPLCVSLSASREFRLNPGVGRAMKYSYTAAQLNQVGLSISTVGAMHHVGRAVPLHCKIDSDQSVHWELRSRREDPEYIAAKPLASGSASGEFDTTFNPQQSGRYLLELTCQTSTGAIGVAYTRALVVADMSLFPMDESSSAKNQILLREANDPKTGTGARRVRELALSIHLEPTEATFCRIYASAVDVVNAVHKTELIGQGYIVDGNYSGTLNCSLLLKQERLQIQVAFDRAIRMVASDIHCSALWSEEGDTDAERGRGILLDEARRTRRAEADWQVNFILCALMGIGTSGVFWIIDRMKVRSKKGVGDE